MSKIITNKTQIQCTLGASPQSLVVTSQNLVKNSGELVATEGDKEGMVNIPSFGTCKRAWFNPACTPNPVKWTETSKHSTILGQKQLIQSSKCKCQFGGEISIIDTGSNKHVSSE